MSGHGLPSLICWYQPVVPYGIEGKPPGAQSTPNPASLSPLPPFRHQVGTYKLNPDLKKKAEAHRQKKNEEEEEARRKRLEALSARKQDKAAEEKVCVYVCACA